MAVPPNPEVQAAIRELAEHRGVPSPIDRTEEEARPARQRLLEAQAAIRCAELDLCNEVKRAHVLNKATFAAIAEVLGCSPSHASNLASQSQLDIRPADVDPLDLPLA